MKPDDTFYVVAGNYNEFLEYSKSKKDNNFYSYVRSREDLLGLNDIKGFFIGSYKQRKDIEEIKNKISEIKAKKSIANSIVGSVIATGANGISGSNFAVSSGSITSTTISGIDELKKRIDDLEKQVKDLYSKNNPGPADFSNTTVAINTKSWYNITEGDSHEF